MFLLLLELLFTAPQDCSLASKVARSLNNPILGNNLMIGDCCSTSIDVGVECNLSNITKIRWADRALRGNLTTTLGYLTSITNLQVIDLSGNSIIGSVPIMGSITEMYVNNTQLSVMSFPSNIVILNASSSNFVGNIQGGVPFSATNVDLSNNQLSGQIGLGDSNHPIPNLLSLDLSRNNLTGVFYINAPNILRLNISNNYLTVIDVSTRSSSFDAFDISNNAVTTINGMISLNTIGYCDVSSNPFNPSDNVPSSCKQSNMLCDSTTEIDFAYIGYINDGYFSINVFGKNLNQAHDIYQTCFKNNKGSHGVTIRKAGDFQDSSYPLDQVVSNTTYLKFNVPASENFGHYLILEQNGDSANSIVVPDSSYKKVINPFLNYIVPINTGTLQIPSEYKSQFNDAAIISIDNAYNAIQCKLYIDSAGRESGTIGVNSVFIFDITPNQSQDCYVLYHLKYKNRNILGVLHVTSYDSPSFLGNVYTRQIQKSPSGDYKLKLEDSDLLKRNGYINIPKYLYTLNSPAISQNLTYANLGQYLPSPLVLNVSPHGRNIGYLYINNQLIPMDNTIKTYSGVGFYDNAAIFDTKFKLEVNFSSSNSFENLNSTNANFDQNVGIGYYKTAFNYPIASIDIQISFDCGTNFINVFYALNSDQKTYDFCAPCPLGADCFKNGTMPTAKRGYYLSSTQMGHSYEYNRCINADSCQGANVCAEGYANPDGIFYSY
eukprot:NODE_347_length_9026_cov_0.640641.p1 type:complete len:719 gc:universal NODE_347_length_9026_cov_0.640641:8908-6752(-)